MPDKPNLDNNQQNSNETIGDPDGEKLVCQSQVQKIDDKHAKEDTDHSDPKQTRLQKIRAWWKDPFRRRASWNDKAVVFLTFGIVFLAAMQWREMYRGGQDTDNLVQYSKQQACAADKSAKAAGDFARAAEGIQTKIGIAEGDFAKMAGNSEKAIKATQAQMRLDQRAWVAASGVTGIPTVDKQFIVQTIAFNAGRTFAKQFRMAVVVQHSQSGMKPDFTKENIKEKASYHSLSLLTPNGIYTAKNIMTGDGSVPFARNPTKEDIDAIKTGKVDIYTFGRMDYVDIFKTPHWAIFCFKLTPDLVWINCKEHNDTDNNRVPN